MAWTKRNFVIQALKKTTVINTEQDAEPEELQDALVQLNAMLGEWSKVNIDFNWTQPTGGPTSDDLDVVTEVPDGDVLAVYSNLAVRIAEDYGKICPPRVTSDAHRTYRELLGRFNPNDTGVTKRQMPAGAGNRYGYGYGYGRNFIYPGENYVSQEPEE